MTTSHAEPQTKSKGKLRPPARLHHNNFYTSDLEACRHFYEDIAGLPLVAFWVEPVSEAYGTRAHVLGHAFFGLADGGMMAFMHYPDEDLQAKSVGTEQPPTVHIALSVDGEQYADIRSRLLEQGYGPQDMFEINHGFVQSLYVRDPDRLLVEFGVDPPGIDQMYAEQRTKAHETLRRYLDGDLTPTSPAKN